jgi:hypothetical protein
LRERQALEVGAMTINTLLKTDRAFYGHLRILHGVDTMTMDKFRRMRKRSINPMTGDTVEFSRKTGRPDSS